jgi:hypothetical protein
MKELLNEILDDTLAYYDSKDKLARDNFDNGCHYLQTSTGNQCAVGRYFTEEIVEKLKSRPDENDPLFQAIQGDVYDFEHVFPLDSVLVDKVKGVPLRFWSTLQQLHDSVLFKYEEDHHVNRVVKEIRDNIKLNRYETV